MKGKWKDYILNGECEIPDGIKEIEEYAFNGSLVLEKLSFPESVKTIGKNAFAGSSKLQKVELNEGLERIEEVAFYNCSNLKEINFPSTLNYIGKEAFSRSGSIEKMAFPASVKEIPSRVCRLCLNLEEIIIPEGVESIGSSAFHSTKIKEISLPKSLKKIDNFAFAGCPDLENIELSANTNVTSNIFFGTKLKVLAKKGDKFILQEKIDENLDSSEIIIDMNGFEKYIMNANISFFMVDEGSKTQSSNPNKKLGVRHKVEKYKEFCEKVKKNNMIVTFGIFERLMYFDRIDDFLYNTNMKNFKQIRKIIPEKMASNDIWVFFMLCYNIGCFSNNPTLNQKANNWLLERLKEKTMVNKKTGEKRKAEADIPFNQIHNLFKEMNFSGENQEFSNFLFGKNSEKKETFFSDIKKEEKWGELLCKIHKEFLNPEKGILPGGRFRDEKTGNLMFAQFSGNKRREYLPTVEVFKTYFDSKGFEGVENEQDKKLADEMQKWPGYTQEHFDRAKSVLEEFEKLEISPNITKKPLSNLDKIVKDYKEITGEYAKQGLQIALDKLEEFSETIETKFDFEWIEKNDTINFVLGLYCNCCANLEGCGYGILRGAVIDPNIQNLVIKDRKGIPVAKSTFYLNKEEGYGIFNNVEIVDSINNDDDLEELYKEYQKGISRFVEVYNAENPENPIKQINVGMNVNDLKEKIVKYAKPSEIVKGVNFGEYGIEKKKYEGDWAKSGQYCLWKMEGDDYEKDL